MTSRRKVTDDSFITTLHELHCEAPIELFTSLSLRSQFGQINLNNPNCAQTAEVCLNGLASDRRSLLHVLTAAYLINKGVMIKHQAVNEEEKSEYKGLIRENIDIGNEFDSHEEELNNFSITINGDLKPKTGLLSAQPPQGQSLVYSRDLSEHF
jgi:hypothetical protein